MNKKTLFGIGGLATLVGVATLTGQVSALPTHGFAAEVLVACSGSADCGFIDTYINPFIKFLSALVGVVAIISVITAGIQYSSAEGDSNKVSAAKQRIRNMVIGLIAYLLLLSALNFMIPGSVLTSAPATTETKTSGGN